MPRSRFTARGILLGGLVGATVLMCGGPAVADSIPLETPAVVPQAEGVVGGACLPDSTAVLGCLISSLSSRTPSVP